MSEVKVRFLTIADYEEEEQWLREQHRRGLRLTKMVIPCFYHFEVCEPEDVVYRLDFQNAEMNWDYLQMFRDYGWEYCNNCLGWRCFRKPASQIQSETEGEIFSDNASKVEMVQRIVRTRLLPILIIFLCCVLPNWCRMISMSVSAGETVFVGIFTALLFLYMYLILHCGLKLKRLREKYQDK